MLYVTSADTSENLSTNNRVFAVERVAQRLDENGDEIKEANQDDDVDLFASDDDAYDDDFDDFE